MFLDAQADVTTSQEFEERTYSGRMAVFLTITKLLIFPPTDELNVSRERERERERGGGGGREGDRDKENQRGRGGDT